MGGVSRDRFATFNLSPRVGDDPRAVSENRRRLRSLLAPLRLVLPRQVHGDTVRFVSQRSGAPGEADALVTNEVGLALSVLTADCVPVLLVAPRSQVAAIVHAGWRGTALAVVRRAIESMISTYGVDPSAVHAALGPAIGGCCYEVGEDVLGAIQDRHGQLPDGVWRRERERVWLDLRGINAAMLERNGVPAANVTQVGPCTRCAGSELFSHRGAGGPTGRQLSFVGWRPVADRDRVVNPPRRW